MDVQRDVEMIDETKFKYIQRAKDEVRELIYDYKRCNGCGICVYACPVNAIELGPIHDIALGLEMPPVVIDHLKCAYCGICYSYCPFNVYEFYINEEKVSKDELPLSPVRYTYKYDNCKECTLCYKACPTNAITRHVYITRQQIEEKNEGLEGKLHLDREKCNFCGICVEFCEVFKLVEKEIKPDDIMPYEEILVDESKCDYCVLCEDICPEEALKIEGKRINFKLPEKIAEIEINQELCSHCGYCEKICPYDAAKTIKPIDGELGLFEARMYRCDPVGCAACIIICKHNRVWYVSKDKGRVHFNAEFCVYCGACENSCPYDLIEVKRHNYYTKELAIDAPWREAWEDALSRVIAKERVKEPDRRFLKEEREVEIVEEEIEFKEIDDETRKALEEKLKPIEQALKRAGYRRAFETGKLELFLKGVKHAKEA